MAMPIPAAIRNQSPYYTVDILDQLPDDGNRYEVVYGDWTPEATLPVVERTHATWAPAEAAETFTLDLAELFAPIP
jgi:hypothetical protein